MLDVPRTYLELRLQRMYQMKGDAHSRTHVDKYHSFKPKVFLPLASCARTCRRTLV